jgi:hypothetical protein
MQPQNWGLPSYINLKLLRMVSSVYECEIFNMILQLFLMKQGGQEIYVGPLGRHSCHLIKYFEVSMQNVSRCILDTLIFIFLKGLLMHLLYFYKGNRSW